MEKNPVIQMKDDYQELELGTTLADLKMSFGSRVYLVLASNPKKAFHSGSYVLQKGTVYILRDPGSCLLVRYFRGRNTYALRDPLLLHVC